MSCTWSLPSACLGLACGMSWVYIGLIWSLLWSWEAFVVHKLQSALDMVFFTSTCHFFIMLKVNPVGDGSGLVDAFAMTVLNYSSVMSLLNMSSISMHSCGLFETCDIPYQMLLNAAVGILSDIFDTVDLK